MQEQKNKLISEFIQFKGSAEQTDDVTVVGIELQ